MNYKGDLSKVVKLSEPSKKYIWMVRGLILIFIFLFSTWLILFQFSNILFGEFIKKSFSNLSNDQYKLEFNNLRINALTFTISLYNTHLYETDSLKSSVQSDIDLKAEKFVLKRIDLIKLFKKETLKIKAVSIDGLSLDITDLKEKNRQNIDQKLKMAFPSFFNQIYIYRFNVNQLSFNYKSENETINIPSLSFDIEDISVDSLQNKVITNRFHFADINFRFRNQNFVLPNKNHYLSCKLLSFSSKEKDLNIEHLKILPIKSNSQSSTNFTLYLPHIKLEDFELDSLINNNQLLGKFLLINFDHVRIELIRDSLNAKVLNLKNGFDSILENTFSKIAFDSTVISLSPIEVSFPNNQELNFKGQTQILLKNPCYLPKDSIKYTLSDGRISFNEIIFEDSKSKQSFHLENSKISFTDKMLTVKNLTFLKDSIPTQSLFISSIKLENINWPTFINENSLLADKLSLIDGEFMQSNSIELSSKEISQTNIFVLQFLKSISIDTIQLKDWSYQLKSKSVYAHKIDVGIKSFQFPGNSGSPFGSFSQFWAQINSLKWQSKDKQHQFQLTNIESNSKNNSIRIEKGSGNPIRNFSKNKIDEAKTYFNFYFNTIELQTFKPLQEISFSDTLKLRKLSIDSLNIEQFGLFMNQNSDLMKSIPPVFVHTFDLHKGEYSLYKERKSKQKQAELRGIELKGKSVELISDSVITLNFETADARTKNGFYRNETQGVSFNFNNIFYDSKTESIELKQFQTQLQLKNKDSESSHKLNLKQLVIKGFNHNLFLQKSIVSAFELNLQSPVLVSKGSSFTEPSNFDLRKLLNEDSLSKLPIFKFKNININNLKWSATHTKKGSTFINSFEKVNLQATDFELSYSSFSNPDRVFFSESVKFNIENIKQHLNNGLYLILIQDADFSSWNKQFNFNNIQFYTLQKENKNNFHFIIDKIGFNDINFADLQHNNSLTINNVVVSNPKTKIRIYGFDNNSLAKNLHTVDLYPFIKPYFSRVVLNEIAVQNMSLDIEAPKEKSTNLYNLGHLDINIYKFRLDSLTKAFYNNRFFYSENTNLNLRNYSALIAEQFYRIKFNSMQLSTLKRTMDVDSIYIIPEYSYAEFARLSQYQTDRFDISVAKIKLTGIDFQDALFRQKYKVKKAIIKQMHGEDYRDGLYARRPDYYLPNPIDRFLSLPYFIQLDTLLIKDSYFAYKELGTHTSEPGHIYFKDLNAQILNVSNNPDFIKYGGSLLFNANAMLMGKARLEVFSNFPLHQRGKSFDLSAQLDQIEMDDLEPIFLPLALIQARSGTIKSIDLAVKANDDFAYGNMLMIYHNMKIDVLRKSMRKGFFGTIFANAFIKTENPSYLIPRKGPIYFERNKQRSLFNYWAEISILGMKTSMGLADRRTAKKVKELQKKNL